MTDELTKKVRTNFDQKTKEIGKIKCRQTCLWRQNSDRNSKDLIESEEINKRWQEYPEELCRKGLNYLL